MNDIKREMAGLASRDAEILDELSAWLRAYEYEVAACGRCGDIESSKIKELSRDAIKKLVNYI